MYSEVKRLLSALGLVISVFCALPAAAGDDKFDISRFIVEGNTLLPHEIVEAAVTPFSGKDRSYADVQRALEALELKYRQAGFGAVIVHVPEQELTQGVVRLQVIEARLRNIVVQYQPAEGKDYFSLENVRAGLPKLVEGVTPSTPAIAEAIQLVNENPAKQVEVVLKAGENPGQIDAEVVVQASDPKKMFLTLDNTGSDSTGQHRLGIGFQHANLFDRDHSATFNYTTSPEKPDQVNLYSMSYRLPLYERGDALDFIYAKSDVNAGTTATVAGPLQFTGKGDIYGVRYNWLLPRDGEYSHRLVTGLDWRVFDNSCTLGVFGATACGASAVDVTVRPISLTYSGQWQQPRQAVDFSLTLVQNLPGADKGEQADFNCSRRPGNVTTECDLDAKENLQNRAVAGAIQGGPPARYTLLRLNGSYMKSFSNDVQVRLAGSAQYTPQALLPVEQFGLAGATTVRGFSEREAARDTGYVLNLEVYSPNFAPLLGWGGASLRGVAFLDAASGRSNLLSGETQQNVQLASWGIGVRLSLGKTLSAKLDAAQVIDGDSLRVRHDTHGHFNLYLAF